MYQPPQLPDLVQCDFLFSKHAWKEQLEKSHNDVSRVDGFEKGRINSDNDLWSIEYCSFSSSVLKHEVLLLLSLFLRRLTLLFSISMVGGLLVVSLSSSQGFFWILGNMLSVVLHSKRIWLVGSLPFCSLLFLAALRIFDRYCTCGAFALAVSAFLTPVMLFDLSALVMILWTLSVLVHFYFSHSTTGEMFPLCVPESDLLVVGVVFTSYCLVVVVIFSLSPTSSSWAIPPFIFSVSILMWDIILYLTSNK